MQDDDFRLRPNDFLVEPLFAPLEPAQPPPRLWFVRLFAWVFKRG